MTKDEEQGLGERMERIEERLDRVEQGQHSLERGQRDLVRRMDKMDEMRGQLHEIHEALIGDLGDEPKFVRRAEFNILRAEVDRNTKWRESKDAQGRLIDWVLGGGFVTLIIILYALIQYFGG